MASQRRRVVGTTTAQFQMRRWCGLVPMITLVIFILAFQGRILLHTMKAFNDYVVTIDHQSESNARWENATSKFEKIEDHLTSRNPFTSSHGVDEEKGTRERERRDRLESSHTNRLVDPSESNAKSKGDTYAHHNNIAMKKDLQAVQHFPAHGDDGIEMLLELDGLVGSKAFHLINDVNASMHYPNVVWIGSPVPRRLCHMTLVQQAMEYYRMKNPKTLVKPDWTFHLLDWADGTDRLLECEELHKLVDKKNVHYWKRSNVIGRHWNATTQSVELGRISTELNGTSFRPLHLATRTDIVEGIAATVTSMTNQSMTPKEISEYIVTKDRPGDVAHHWPARGGPVDRGSRQSGRNDLLRTTTSLTLKKMRKRPYNLTDVFSGMLGAARDQGRGSTNNAYIDSLLHYKIMVVAQRDIFEGHLRLFEGLASGAMVLHDRILSAPIGLEENVNIVYFDNQNELKEKIMYSLTHHDERLAIARRGRHLAMCQSRTWHRMEQIILGRTVTPCHE